VLLYKKPLSDSPVSLGVDGENLKIRGVDGVNLKIHGVDGVNLKIHVVDGENLKICGVDGVNLKILSRSCGCQNSTAEGDIKKNSSSLALSCLQIEILTYTKVYCRFLSYDSGECT
jgi:hypothetical protein